MTSPLSILQPTLPHARVPDTAPLAPWGENVRRILCVRPDNLGDVLMTTPALHALRHAARCMRCATRLPAAASRCWPRAAAPRSRRFSRMSTR